MFQQEKHLQTRTMFTNKSGGSTIASSTFAASSPGSGSGSGSGAGAGAGGEGDLASMVFAFFGYSMANISTAYIKSNCRRTRRDLAMQQ